MATGGTKCGKRGIYGTENLFARFLIGVEIIFNVVFLR